jgi:hypothetical protein
MVRVTLSDIPAEPTDVEDYVSALFRSAGWSVEAGVVLREEGTEILELDARAVQLEREGRRVVLSEAKSGAWGAPDLFKLLGWQTYLRADVAVFASTRSESSVTGALRRHAEGAGLTLLHLNDPVAAARGFEAAGFGKPIGDEIGLWRLAALVERCYRAKILSEVKERRDAPGPNALKEFHRLVGERVLFLPDPGEQATALYEAHDSHPRLTLALARELDGEPFSPSEAQASNARLQNALRFGGDLLLHCSMWVEYRSRLALLRAAVELALDQRAGGDKSANSFDWSLFALRTSFHNGLEWLGSQPTFWRYPALWEQLCWTWGGFLLTDRLDVEYDQLAAASGVPSREVPGALTTFDRLFPLAGGWFKEPGPTKARRLALFPFHFHGIGAFRRRRAGWVPPLDSPSDHTGADVVRWNNATVGLIGS